MIKFHGSDYEPRLDMERLTKQLEVIEVIMKDGKWRTHSHLRRITGFKETSIARQIRNFRNTESRYTLQKRRCQKPEWGMFEFRLVPKETEEQMGLAI